MYFRRVILLQKRLVQRNSLEAAAMILLLSSTLQPSAGRPFTDRSEAQNQNEQGEVVGRQGEYDIGSICMFAHRR